MIQIYICEDEKIQLEFWKRTIEDYIKSAKIMAETVLHRYPDAGIRHERTGIGKEVKREE